LAECAPAECELQEMTRERTREMTRRKKTKREL
jgi:ribosomal protein L34E